MLAPGEESPVEELSGFFGGTELTDWVGHVGLFGVFTVLLHRVLGEDDRPTVILITCIVFAVGFGTMVEALQLVVPNRGATLIDMIGNWIGVAGMGAVLRRVR